MKLKNFLGDIKPGHCSAYYSKPSDLFGFDNKMLLVFSVFSLILAGRLASERHECYTCDEKLDYKGRVANGDQVKNQSI